MSNTEAGVVVSGKCQVRASEISEQAKSGRRISDKKLAEKVTIYALVATYNWESGVGWPGSRMPTGNTPQQISDHWAVYKKKGQNVVIVAVHCAPHV